MSDHLERADEIARDVVAAHAPRVDAEGVFPAESIEALRQAGLLGLISAAEVGGAGRRHRAAAAGRRAPRARVRLDRDGHCMHYCGAAVIEALRRRGRAPRRSPPAGT